MNPLKKIEDIKEMKEATHMVSALVGMELSEGQEQYLEVLKILVNEYVCNKGTFGTPGEVLRDLMSMNEISNRELAREIEVDHSYISHIKSGRRLPGRKTIKKLAKYFSISEAVFV